MYITVIFLSTLSHVLIMVSCRMKNKKYKCRVLGKTNLIDFFCHKFEIAPDKLYFGTEVGYHEKKLCCLRVFNPLSPNSDKHQISPCNINAYPTPEVMRIKDMITQG